MVMPKNAARRSIPARESTQASDTSASPCIAARLAVKAVIGTFVTTHPPNSRATTDAQARTDSTRAPVEVSTSSLASFTRWLIPPTWEAITST